MNYVVKSWLLPAFFFLALLAGNSSAESVEAAETMRERIASKPQWHALLHVKGQESAISDPKFTLSAPHFSPRAELDALIAYVNASESEATCRFPARVYWLKKQLNNSTKHLDVSECAELNKYINHVPFDSVEIIFASEVLSSASSMMGHVFLKAKGENYRGNEVSHALSFFTEYDTFNPFSIIYNGLVKGMPGFFIVRPYEKELVRYLNTEGRNVFEYTLSLDEDARQLLQLHLWELKDIDITYLFQSYNCATLTLYLLGIVQPEIKVEETLFVTPADVVKAAAKVQLIAQSKVNLANEWAVAALELQLGTRKVNRLKRMLSEGKSTDYGQFEALTPLELEYVKRLIAIEQKMTPSDSYKYDDFDKLLDRHEQFQLNRKTAKNPLDTVQDSALSIGVERFNQSERAVLSFLPASHYLRTSEPQFFNESELRIAETQLSVNTQSGNVRLDRFTLYAFESYMPSTQSLPRWSGTLFIGYQQAFDDALNDEGFFSLEGGLGKSLRLHRDVIGYGTAEAGFGTRLSEDIVYGRLNAGLFVNLAWQSSLRFEASVTVSDRVRKPLNHFVAELSAQPNNEYGVYVRLEHFDSSVNKEVRARAGFDWYF